MMHVVTPKHEYWQTYLNLCYFYFCENWPNELVGKQKESFLLDYEQLLNKRFEVGKRFFSLHQEEKEIFGFANSYISSDDSFNIAEFYIQPEFRRMGNGKKMFFELLELARAGKVKKIIIEVDKDLIGANTFWESLGLSLDNQGNRNVYHTNAHYFGRITNL